MVNGNYRIAIVNTRRETRERTDSKSVLLTVGVSRDSNEWEWRYKRLIWLTLKYI